MSGRPSREVHLPQELADVSTGKCLPQGPASSEPPLVPVLTLVSHPMVGRAGERLVLEALGAGRPVELSRNAPDFIRPGETFGQPLADPFVSRTPLVFSPEPEGGVRLRVPEGGTQVVLGEPLRGAHVFTAEELRAGVPLELGGHVVLLLHQTESRAVGRQDDLGMVGQSEGVRSVREHIQRISDLHVPVLIRGETGTGKELVAQALHAHGPRRDKPFVSVNLGALPRELAASELFGALRGAFTGATRDREGLFHAAQGGTLFLDEVGEAPAEVQVMLLRVLESGEFYPVGSRLPARTNARLIAATDAHLEQHIRDGRFKEPLLHRLAGYEIRLPPLRERREDIGLLFHHFARAALTEMGEVHRLTPSDPYAEPWMPTRLAVRLLRYPWPGNIRQLRNLARQVVMGSRGQPVLSLEPRLAEELDAAAAPLPPASPVPESSASPPPPRRRSSTEVTPEQLLAALREHVWDLKKTADALGIARSSLYDLIDKSPTLRRAGALSAEELIRCHHECAGDLEAMVRRLEVSRKALTRRLKELGLNIQGP